MARSPAGERGLWRERNFLILVTGQWVSIAGSELFALAVAWTVLAETHSRVLLGLVAGLGTLGAAAGVVSGVLADRWDRRRTMMVSDAVRVALCAAIAWTAWAGSAPVWAMAAAYLALGLAGSVFSPAARALFPTLVAPGLLVEANGAYQGASSTAQLAGLAVGGAAIGAIGAAAAFAADGLSFAVSVLTLGLMQLPHGARAPSAAAGAAGGDGLMSRLAEGYRHIWSDRVLRRMLLVNLLLNFFVAPINVLDVVWVRQVLHQSATVYGLFGAAILGGMVVGSSAVAGPLGRRVGTGAAAMAGLVVSGSALAVFSQVASTWPDMALFAVFGAAIGVTIVHLSTQIQRIVPNRLLGRVSGVLGAAGSLTGPVGVALSGVTSSLVPISDVFLVSGALFAMGAAVLIGVPWRSPAASQPADPVPGATPDA